MFDLGALCECISNHNHPKISEILETLNRNSICTGTQCFESLNDLIPMTPPTQPSAVDAFLSILPFFVLLTFLATTRPPHLLEGRKPKRVAIQMRRTEDEGA